MNTIDPFTQEVIRRDMHPNVTLALTVFMGAGFLGYYLYDFYLKLKKLESRIEETDHVLHESAMIQEAQADTIREHDERIRAKVDYDEDDEIEEEQYQAWEGEYERYSSYQELLIRFKIIIYKEKLSTKKKNLEWIHRENKDDASVTVRDFYLGNYNPQFDWEYVSRNCYGDEFLEITTHDKFIDGWDSVIRLYIEAKVSVPTVDSDNEEEETEDEEEKSVSTKTQKDEMDILRDYFEFDSCIKGDELMNKILKKLIQEKMIHWTRTLFPEEYN